MKIVLDKSTRHSSYFHLNCLSRHFKRLLLFEIIEVIGPLRYLILFIIVNLFIFIFLPCLD